MKAESLHPESGKEADLISELVSGDPIRIKILRLVRELNLPQGYVAAGFVRNLVWDHLHGYTGSTPLNDVDVIWYDSSCSTEETDREHEIWLSEKLPGINWQVRNQARMHIRNGDSPYANVVDAMGFWPEKETAVAVRMTGNNRIECVSAFGLDSLFSLELTYNNHRDKEVFQQRAQTKDWLKKWPDLKVR